MMRKALFGCMLLATAGLIAGQSPPKVKEFKICTDTHTAFEAQVMDSDSSDFYPCKADGTADVAKGALGDTQYSCAPGTLANLTETFCSQRFHFFKGGDDNTLTAFFHYDDEFDNQSQFNFLATGSWSKHIKSLITIDYLSNKVWPQVQEVYTFKTKRPMPNWTV